ncbi:MAG: hypothetical protein EA402_05305 [Planctomycetota bacterium]|nr:MAG: hypothetical protein EA402_05305 [Planctomycetota bacterium]
MFDLFKSLLRRGAGADAGLLFTARAQIIDTLGQAQEVLAEAVAAIASGQPGEGLEQRARSADKASNKAERELRKILVEHLAFSQTDGPACLVMMSVGKDVERLVDECRNLADLAVALGADPLGKHRQDLAPLAQEVHDLLARTCKAFADNDEAEALSLVESEKPFIARCHELGDRIIADEGLGVRPAVLLSRSIHVLHRLRAHLANIASTVVFPVHRIDFAKRSYIEDARKELGIDP